MTDPAYPSFDRSVLLPERPGAKAEPLAPVNNTGDPTYEYHHDEFDDGEVLAVYRPIEERFND